MKKITLICSLVVLTNLLNAQTIPLKEFENMSMRSIGPATTSGRVTAIDAIDGANGPIYIGTASGGVWKSTSAGLNWVPIFDDQEVIGIGALKIAPSNQDVIWVGTGEGNPRNSQTSGKGIYRSLDGGKTWNKKGLEETKTIHRLCIDSRNENVVFAGASGSAWGPTSDRGVYKTTNGGESWEKILFINDSVGCADLVMDPHNSNKLFAAMWQYGRHPWFFNSGGKGSGLHITVDGGKTWKQLSKDDGMPEGNLGRIGLAIAPSNSSIVYAMIEAEKTGLYKSTDGGFTWDLITNEHIDDRPFYYSEFYVDPSNENHLIYLHSTVSESIDGGKTWNTLLPYWGVHPDHHAFWWSNENPSFLIEGNDGGLNISRDGGRNWQFAGNLPLGQFYHINYDLETPYNVYGGMQDNGSWKGPGYVWHEGGIIDADWLEVMFGDGFDVVPHPENSKLVYAMSQGGEVAMVDTETGISIYAKPVSEDSTKLRFNWNTAIAANEKGVYLGSQFVHLSQDEGRTWKRISPDLTTNNREKQLGYKSGGLTTDATSAENYCTILAISPSDINPEIIWVGTDDGNVQLSRDGGKSWNSLISAISGAPKEGWVPFILPGANNEGEAFVVINNYRKNDWKPYLFHTSDYGKSWKNLVSEKTIMGHCLSIAQDPIAENLLFLGTEHGLYVSFDYGKNWEKWTHNYPSVATQDLKIHPVESDLIIGTFGRAAYILDNIEPMRQAALQGASIFEKKIKAFDSPKSYIAYYTRPRGQRFPADSYFEGDNKSGGTQLTYHFKVDKDLDKNEKEKKKKQGEDSEKPKDKKVRISVFNMLGDTMRVFTHEPDTGLNVLDWIPSEDGFFWPRRDERKPDAEIPDGYSLAPGKYKVVYSFNGEKDSASFELAYDPRLNFEISSFEKGKKEFVRFGLISEKVNNQMSMIRDFKKSIETTRTALAFVPDSLKKEILTEADSLEKVIADFENQIFGPKEEKGITDGSMYIISDVYTAMSYHSNGTYSSAGNSELAFKKAEEKLNEISIALNAFLENQYLPWKTKVENLKWSPVKEIRKLD